MSADVEITITVRGGEVSAGGTQIVESAAVPAPSAEIAGPGAVSTGFEEGAPAPIDALGSGEMTGAAPVPSSELGGAVVGTTTGAALPTPVPLEQIEQLGSSDAAESGGDKAPAPQGNEA